MKTYPQMSNWQRSYVSYIAEHPSCIVADVVRACLSNPQAGHKHVYDGVHRLIKQEVLRAEFKRGKVYLYVNE